MFECKIETLDARAGRRQTDTPDLPVPLRSLRSAGRALCRLPRPQTKTNTLVERCRRAPLFSLSLSLPLHLSHKAKTHSYPVVVVVVVDNGLIVVVVVAGDLFDFLYYKSSRYRIELPCPLSRSLCCQKNSCP